MEHGIGYSLWAMKHTVRRLAVLLAVLSVTTAAWAAGQPQPAVRVLVPQTTAALPFLLLEKNQGVPGAQITVTFFANHAQALALLLRGEADLLLSGTSQGWENRLDGSPIVMVDTGVWGVSSLIGRDPSIKGFADLKGKRIAMPFPGSPLDFQSRALLAFDKLDPDKDVTISFGPFPQSVQRLLSGQLDAVAVPEPLATTLVRKNGLLRLVDYSQAWARFTGGDRMSPQVSLFTTEGYAADHKPLLAAVVSAWDAATKTVVSSAKDMAVQFSTALAVDPPILEEAIANTLLSVPPASENRTRVLAYYRVVSRWFPASPRPLDERFFVVP